MAHPEIAALNDYRLSHDCTWLELSEAMAEVGVNVSPRTLYHLLKGMPPDREPRDRTLYKLRTFLKIVSEPEPEAESASA